MHTTMAVESIQEPIVELINRLNPGDVVTLTLNQQVVAELRIEPVRKLRPPPGLGKGSIVYMAPDFDAPIELF